MLLFLETDLHLQPFDLGEWLPLLKQLIGRLLTLLKNYKFTFANYTFSAYSFLLALFVIGIVLPVVVNVAHSIALGNENRDYNIRNRIKSNRDNDKTPPDAMFFT